MAKASISLILAIATITASSFRTFAATQTGAKATEQIMGDQSSIQTQTATITVLGGVVTINGNTAQTGATVLSGSAVSTGSGRGVINLGVLGVIKLSENTTISITFSSDSFEIRTNCSRTQVDVIRGTVDVKSPKAETLTAGKRAQYDGGVTATSSSTDVEVDCKGRTAAGTFQRPRLVRLLVLVGIAAAVAAGIAVVKKKK